MWDYFTVDEGLVHKDQLGITHTRAGNFPNKDITFPVGLRIPYHLRGLTAAQYNHEVKFEEAIATVKAKDAIGVVMPNIVVTFHPPPLAQLLAAVPAVPAAVPAVAAAVPAAAVPAAVPGAVVAPVLDDNSAPFKFVRLLWNAHHDTAFCRKQYRRYVWLKGCSTIEELFERGKKLAKTRGGGATSTSTIHTTKQKKSLTLTRKRQKIWIQSKRLSEKAEKVKYMGSLERDVAAGKSTFMSHKGKVEKEEFCEAMLSIGSDALLEGVRSKFDDGSFTRKETNDQYTMYLICRLFNHVNPKLREQYEKNPGPLSYMTHRYAAMTRQLVAVVPSVGAPIVTSLYPTDPTHALGVVQALDHGRISQTGYIRLSGFINGPLRTSTFGGIPNEYRYDPTAFEGRNVARAERRIHATTKGKRVPSEHNISTAMKEVTKAAEICLGSNKDVNGNLHWRSFGLQLQIILDIERLHGPFSNEDGSIRERVFDENCGTFTLYAKYDGNSTKRRSFMILGFVLGNQPNSKHWFHVVGVSEGPDTGDNFKRHAGSFYVKEIDTFQKEGWTSSDGKKWKVNIFVVADGKAIHQLYNPTRHKGRNPHTRLNPKENCKLRRRCDWLCGHLDTYATCYHVTRLSPAMVDNLVVPHPDYRPHPESLLMKSEGENADPIAVLKDEYDRLISRSTVINPAVALASQKMKREQLEIQIIVQRKLCRVGLVDWGGPEGSVHPSYIGVASKSRMSLYLRLRLPSDVCDDVITNRSEEELRDFVLPFVEYESWLDRSFGLPPIATFTPDGQWLAGSVIRDPKKIIDDILHIGLRVSEHVVNLCIFAVFSDGGIPRQILRERANTFANEVKLVVSTSDQLATESIQVLGKDGEKLTVIVSIDGEDVKKLFAPGNNNEFLAIKNVLDAIIPDAVAPPATRPGFKNTAATFKSDMVDVMVGFGTIMRDVRKLKTLWNEEGVREWMSKVVDPWGKVVFRVFEDERVTEYLLDLITGTIAEQLLQHVNLSKISGEITEQVQGTCRVLYKKGTQGGFGITRTASVWYPMLRESLYSLSNHEYMKVGSIPYAAVLQVRAVLRDAKKVKRDARDEKRNNAALVRSNEAMEVFLKMRDQIRMLRGGVGEEEMEKEANDKFLNDQWEEEKAVKESDEKEDDADVESIHTDGSVGRRTDFARENLQQNDDMDEMDAIPMAPLGGEASDDEKEEVEEGDEDNDFVMGYDSTDIAVHFRVHAKLPRQRSPVKNTSPNKGCKKKMKGHK